MIEKFEMPVEIPDGWTLFSQVNEDVRRNRDIVVPKIAAWLVKWYRNNASGSLHARVRITLHAFLEEEIDVKPFSDPIVQKEIIAYLEQRGWSVEAAGNVAYLTPLARPDQLQLELPFLPQPSPSIISHEPDSKPDSKSTERAEEGAKAKTTGWWALPFGALF